eukprot:TRINITY_DN11800_c0_g2_i1.p2 TRINITY_DN11800_c0_g2~~TRINITY_DN11800_c0_g2_i1.p2  ORF type:complete len:112 (+),score=47.94 TRINITY_DN11800_c0_g2_i1:71-406(+)
MCIRDRRKERELARLEEEKLWGKPSDRLKPVVQGYVRQTTEKLMKDNSRKIRERREKMREDDMEYEYKIQEMKDRVYDRELLMNKAYGKKAQEDLSKASSKDKGKTEKSWK